MLKELKNIFTDQGVLLLSVIVPLFYPLLYSFVYTNEVVRDVPVCVVDKSNSSSSREFIRKMDATPDIDVAYRCADLKEAQRLMAQQKSYGIVMFPRDFDTKIARMEQATISTYLDMSFMVYYKTVYMAMTNLVLENNTKIQLKLANNMTRQEDELQAATVKIKEVRMYNTTDGYGNSLLQIVLVLIVQQTMLLSICMRAGWRRQKKASGIFVPEVGTLKEYFSVTSAFGIIYLVAATYILLVTPMIFGFTQRISLVDFFIFLIPTLFAMLNLAMLLSLFFKKREDSMVCIVFTSVPMLFLVGFSWPEAAVPQFWQCFAWILPSTPAARTFAYLNEMGASLQSVFPYLAVLIAQGLFYMLAYFIIKGFRTKKPQTPKGGMVISPRSRRNRAGSINSKPKTNNSKLKT